METRLRDIIQRQRQRQSINDQAETVRILSEETVSLAQVVRTYPEDDLPLEAPN